MAINIFLSYASPDKPVVRELYNRLKEAGHEAWFDAEGISQGEDWNLIITRAIRNADIFIAVLSEQSVQRRGMFQKELKIALDKMDEMLPGDIFIIPLRIDDCEIPYSIRHIHWLDWEGGKGFGKLVKSIQAVENSKYGRQGKLSTDVQLPELENDERESSQFDSEETFSVVDQINDKPQDTAGDAGNVVIPVVLPIKEAGPGASEQRPDASRDYQISDTMTNVSGDGASPREEAPSPTVPGSQREESGSASSVESGNKRKRGDNRPVTSPGEDRTPFHKDTPSDVDYLGRLGFVEALAQWINRNWDEYKDTDKSFVINIHGQWGAGKTTFLNLLERKLRFPDEVGSQDASQDTSPQKWIVVWFNAWENRHIKPEWWPLFDTIYRKSVLHKKASTLDIWWIRLGEWWWRFYSGRKLELSGFLVSLLLLGLTLYWVLRPGGLSNPTLLSDMDTTVKLIAAIFSLLSTIFLGTRFVSQTIASGSAKAAEVYLQFTADPIENIKQHFKDLIEQKINNPIIVFIDDLDRCDRTYIINLLESTQNLLNHGKVFYVIAADQRWLFAAFEETYKEFKDSIREPGKKIGYLFLEKIFQLSMWIPNVSNEAKRIYLDHLLGNEHEMEGMRAQIQQELAGVKNEQELIQKVRAKRAGTIDKVVMREVAVAKSASMEIEQATVHFLSNFAHLMEPNPRAMKRLVTFYGVLRAMAILNDESIVSDLHKRNQLALWTILRMRWPLLADYLEEYPQYLSNFKTGKSNKAIAVDVKDLIKNQEVMDVLNGKGVSVELDKEALMRFTSFKAAERTF